MRFRTFVYEDLDLYLKWVNQIEIWEVDNAGPYVVRTRESFDSQWRKIVEWQRS